MGLFDFPRIHFSGNIDVNVPTINNSFYFPLTIYDATRSEAYLPPRLYFSAQEKITAVDSSLNPTIHFDTINGYWYIEIEPINTIELLRTWCMTPTPSDANSTAPDAAYYPFYVAADNDLGTVEGSSIVGICPGYWNMFGDMSVAMSNVQVTGVQTLDNSVINTWTNASEYIPADVQPFLNASFDTDTAAASGITTASMVETISSQSVYANVFCSNVNLCNTANTNEVFFQGTPYRFQALIYSAWRVVNWMPPMAGSGRFCSSVPMDQINAADQSLLIQFFNNNKAYDKRQLKGVFVTFTIFEVFENRYDQQFYIKYGAKSNPALATTVGSITPWYDGDMISAIAGRNLLSLNMSPIYQNTNGAPGNSIPVNLTPVTSSLKVLDDGNAVFSVDMGNSWPEMISPAYAPPSFMPGLRGEASFETASIGTLVFKCADVNTTEIASIEIDPSANPRNKVFQTGCVFDFLITDKNLIQTVQNNFINAFLSTGNFQVLQEATYMICTDQKGLYAEEGDLPSAGYFVLDNNRIPCKLRIFQKGVPVTEPILVGVAEYIVPEGANDPLNGPNNLNWPNFWQSLKDNDPVMLSASALQSSNNAIYYFVYQNQYTNNQLPPFANPNYTVMDTGSFAVLRVHQKKDYSQYIDPSHPNYTPATFEVVYNEVFKMYDVAYPAMALVHPFNTEQWNTPYMSGLVLQRCDSSLWNNILYMPKSRELSSSQLALLKAWDAYLNKQS